MKRSDMEHVFGQEMEQLNATLADCVRNRRKPAAMMVAGKISGAARMACALGIIDRPARDEIARTAREAAAMAETWEIPVEDIGADEPA